MTKKDISNESNIGKKFNQYITKIDSIKLFYISLFLLCLALLSLVFAVRVQNRQARVVSPASGYGINTPISMGLVTMTVNNVSFSDGQPGFKAPSNMHYAIVDFTVKNNSDKPIDVLPSSDTYAKDQSGAVAYLTPFGLTNPFHAGALLPGEQVKGQLSYIISKTGGVKLYVDGIWSGGVAAFKLQ